MRNIFEELVEGVSYMSDLRFSNEIKDVCQFIIGMSEASARNFAKTKGYKVTVYQKDDMVAEWFHQTRLLSLDTINLKIIKGTVTHAFPG